LAVVLFVVDDWAEDHHDVEVLDDTGPPVGEGLAARVHGQHGPVARD
jgi:hypothetical protein